MSTAISTDYSSYSSALSSVVASSSNDSMVSKDTFLQLLITQLKNQDPLDPQDSSEFIAELASFSSLEQMSNMNTEMETVLEMSATSLIGKTATVIDGNSNEISGTIEGIVYYADGPAIKVDGTDYPFSSVQNIS
jgi:flagellar basal-body rod modification protein FlgD